MDKIKVETHDDIINKFELDYGFAIMFGKYQPKFVKWLMDWIIALTKENKTENKENNNCLNCNNQTPINISCVLRDGCVQFNYRYWEEKDKLTKDQKKGD